MITLQEIEEARRRLAGVVHHTSLLTSRTFGALSGSDVYLKAENMQRTGSFKIRGAYHKMTTLTEQERARGVVAASAGNHAQGVAVAAQAAGLHATVVMPTPAALAKVTATRGYGATVVLHGDSYDDAYQHALELQRDQGAIFVHPFEDAQVIAGQGTIALEILDDLPDAEALVVPVGGGGLISGVAAAAKERKPKIKVYGVQAMGANAAYLSFKAGVIRSTENAITIADGIAVKRCGDLTLQHMLHYVDDVILVEDEDISQAMVMLLERSKLLVEGAGAIALAALLCGRLSLPRRKVVSLLSGGNVDINMLAHIIEHGLTNAGRYLMIRTSVVDQPGQLRRLTGVLADLRVNVIDIQHRRTALRMPVNHAVVELTLETRDFQHGEEIIAVLERQGYAVRRLS